MLKFRIYRLPGSREWWLVDSGIDTPIIKVRQWRSEVPTRSYEVGGEFTPRAWIEVTGEAYIQSGYTEAIFRQPVNMEG